MVCAIQCFMTKQPTEGQTVSPKAMAVGFRIARAREQKGYSQAVLAVKVGVTGGAIGQYETGRNLPKLERLERIAVALEVSTEWLLTGDEPDELIKAQTRTEEAALRLIRALPSEQQANALAMLEGLNLRFSQKAQ